MRGRLRPILVVTSACASAPAPSLAPAGELRVAVTVDDLPRHGPQAPGQDRLALHHALLDALARHRVPRVYGFVNAGRAQPGDRASLEAWVAAGTRSGTTPRTTRTSAASGWTRISRTWTVGSRSSPSSSARGRSRSGRCGRALVERHYRIAEVTIDFDDWAYNPPYVRCLERGDTAAVAALEAMFLDSAISQLRWADDTLHRLVGRPVPHVLLLHAGAFDAHVLDRLLTAYEKAGARWIPLDEAIADPVYQREPDPPRSWRGELPMQMLRARQIQGFPFTASPAPLLERICRQAGERADRPDP